MVSAKSLFGNSRVARDHRFGVLRSGGIGVRPPAGGGPPHTPARPWGGRGRRPPAARGRGFGVLRSGGIGARPPEGGTPNDMPARLGGRARMRPSIAGGRVPGRVPGCFGDAGGDNLVIAVPSMKTRSVVVSGGGLGIRRQEWVS